MPNKCIDARWIGFQVLGVSLIRSQLSITLDLAFKHSLERWFGNSDPLQDTSVKVFIKAGNMVVRLDNGTSVKVFI